MFSYNDIRRLQKNNRREGRLAIHMICPPLEKRNLSRMPRRERGISSFLSKCIRASDVLLGKFVCGTDGSELHCIIFVALRYLNSVGVQYISALSSSCLLQHCVSEVCALTPIGVGQAVAASSALASLMVGSPMQQ
jgi:hypothetical protein